MFSEIMNNFFLVFRGQRLSRQTGGGLKNSLRPAGLRIDIGLIYSGNVNLDSSFLIILTPCSALGRNYRDEPQQNFYFSLSPHGHCMRKIFVISIVMNIPFTVRALFHFVFRLSHSRRRSSNRETKLMRNEQKLPHT